MAVGTATALGIGGSILGNMGKGKSPDQATQSQNGFNAYPKEVQDFMLQTLLPQMQSYATGQYQGLPMREMNSEDIDPIFGSTERVRYAMSQLPGASGQGDGQSMQSQQPTSAAIDALRAEMAGRSLAGRSDVQHNLRGRDGGVSSEDYQVLSRLYGGNTLRPKDLTEVLGGVDRTKLNAVLASQFRGVK